MNNKRFEIGASEQPLDIIKETCGFAGIFKQIGVIGDSLASGEFESHDENGNIVYTDMYEYSWPAVLERITGTKYNNYSRGGMTAREYVQSWADDKRILAMESSVYYCVRQQRFVCVRASSGKCQGRQRRLSAG